MQYDKSELYKMLDLMLGLCGRKLDGYKGNTQVIYNANLIIGKEKAWYGDLYRNESWKLQDMARLFQCNVYLLREMDARFDTESNPQLDKAVFAFDKNGAKIQCEKTLKN